MFFKTHYHSISAFASLNKLLQLLLQFYSTLHFNMTTLVSLKHTIITTLSVLSYITITHNGNCTTVQQLCYHNNTSSIPS